MGTALVAYAIFRLEMNAAGTSVRRCEIDGITLEPKVTLQLYSLNIRNANIFRFLGE